MDSITRYSPKTPNGSNRPVGRAWLRRLNTALMWVTDVSVAAAAALYFNVPENTMLLWQSIGRVAEPAAVFVYSIPGVPRPDALRNPASHVVQTAHRPAAATLSNDANVHRPAAATPEDATAHHHPAATPSDTTTVPPPAAAPSDDATVPQSNVLHDAPADSESEPKARPRRTRMKKGPGKPVLFAKRKLSGVPFYLTTIDLTDPESFLVIGLANNAQLANNNTETHGHESFDSFVKRCPGAVVVNGTFFSKDESERVMGNMVSEGRFLKYSRWENYGTTLALTEDNLPVMVTARSEGQPDWSEHWFSLTCGPRLVKDGEVWLVPEVEGFTDSHVLGIGPRSAIGFTKSKDKLYIVTFLCGLSLDQEAKVMKELGCSDAMNLDGGASKGLAVNGKTLIKPGRPLTNVLVVYDHAHKAPKRVVDSWTRFQDGDRPSPPDS